MYHTILIIAQIVVMIVLGVLLWQIWHLFHRKDIHENEPLGEERTNYITRRLTWIGICAGLEAALQIASAILRFIEGI